MKIEIATLGSQVYTDITQWIKFRGVEWSLNQVDSAKSGRNLSSDMQRKKLADKEKLAISCVPLTTREKRSLTALLKPEWLTVKVTTDDMTDDPVTEYFTMYCGATISAAYLIRKKNRELWENFKFSLIEK